MQRHKKSLGHKATQTPSCRLNPGRGRQIQGAEWKRKAAPTAPSDIPPSDPRNNQASFHTMLKRRSNPGCKDQHKHKPPEYKARTRRQTAQNPRTTSRRVPFTNVSTHTPPRRSRWDHVPHTLMTHSTVQNQAEPRPPRLKTPEIRGAHRATPDLSLRMQKKAG